MAERIIEHKGRPHVWRMTGEVYRPEKGLREQYAVAVRGRRCVQCKAIDDRPVCAEMVHHEWHSSRCLNTAKVQRDEHPAWGGSRDGTDRRVARRDGPGGWWYCGQHDPERRRAAQQKRDQARRAEEDERARRRRERWEQSAEGELILSAVAWRDDEIATGGKFCDETCEHHECRLARAVERYVEEEREDR